MSNIRIPQKVLDRLTKHVSMFQDVLKRDAIEGEAATRAQRQVQRSLNASRRRNSEPAETVPATLDAGTTTETRYAT